MKKETKHIHANIVNQSLFYIYKYIDTDISLEDLAHQNSVSKYHFHRIFKEETGKNLFEVISLIRLQKASNLLISNQKSSISEIANSCGYSSHSSFIKAFKKRFLYTPTNWRKGAYKNLAKEILNLETLDLSIFHNIQPKILVSKKQHCAYIRHRGYDKNIKQTWQRLMAFAYERDLEVKKQIGLHHDNPVIIPHNECQYIAAIEVCENFVPSNSISKFEFPKSLCAVFSYKGNYGDVFKLLAFIYHSWLPNSGYEAKTLPPFAVYEKNHFLSDDEEFILDFYVPVHVL